MKQSPGNEPIKFDYFLNLFQQKFTNNFTLISNRFQVNLIIIHFQFHVNGNILLVLMTPPSPQLTS